VARVDLGLSQTTPRAQIQEIAHIITRTLSQS